ncbi:ADP-ribose glycohydrolase OARD1 [Frankliniella fusca]|uniref:ADP-ribose glycohydrolase OARD1 n=1 Tax=Frankliniella fusca TaxID=407009 RepID=A0AAE1LL37_9NEOP|nr:ADP-ribose glycohydrolase OARD1 [Frankliniella fusca]KAK3923495.1 ADP-ribose glycohydrolase OARD1 [Frankliniella fusca]
MKLVHVTGDILGCPPHVTIAHCVSADGRMGAGLAKTLQGYFNLRAQFLSTPRGVGYAVALRRGPRFIVNLVTKEHYYDLPTLADFEESIVNLRRFLRFNNIRELAIPELGSGLDRLNPNDVLNIINDLLKFEPVTVYMYHL